MGISKLFFAEVSYEGRDCLKKNSVKNRLEKQQKRHKWGTRKGKFFSEMNEENIALQASAAVSLDYLSSDRTVC